MAIGTVHPFSPRFRPVAAHRIVESFSGDTSPMEAKSAPRAEARLPMASKTPGPPVLCGAGSGTSADAAPVGRRTATAKRKAQNFLKAANMIDLLEIDFVTAIIIVLRGASPPPFSPSLAKS